MMWTEFIEKIKHFKKEGVKSGLNAASITRLLYSGAFDEMIDDETKKIPAVDRYKKLYQELIAAMESKSQLPKATGMEQIGINKITTSPQLILWRHSVNPFSRHDISGFCRNFLTNEGFELASSASGEITWYKKQSGDNQTQIDVRKSWSGLFDSREVYKQYNGDRLLGIVGIVVSVEKKPYQGGKESLSVTLFNGMEYIEGVRVWPGKNGKIKPEMIEGLTKNSVGLAIIKPKPWNDKAGGSIVGWTRVMGL